MRATARGSGMNSISHESESFTWSGTGRELIPR
jgi:hypothetical protein